MAVKRKKPVRPEPQKQESRFWEEAGTGRKSAGTAGVGAQVRKNRARAARMNLGYAVFMLILLTVIVIALILGMQYASDDQVITYSSGTEEYVHQVSEVGD